MARQNDHTRAEELISTYLDKRLSAEEKVFFERHIASCTDCRAQLETTRSMVAALRAMPQVKAPRSFVLPRKMGRQSAAQPKRSFLTLYPALRLATVVAAMAFVILFAGDLLINRSTSGPARQSSLPAAAPVPLEVQAPTAHQEAPTPAPTAAEAAHDAATNSVGAGTEPPAGVLAPKAVVTETTPFTVSSAMSALGVTTTMTAPTELAMRTQATVEATPAPAVTMFDQRSGAVSGFSAQANLISTQPTIDPLRIIEIALLVLAVVLGIATLIVRRKQV